jgi:hypothetical protein
VRKGGNAVCRYLEDQQQQKSWVGGFVWPEQFGDYRVNEHEENRFGLCIAAGALLSKHVHLIVNDNAVSGDLNAQLTWCTLRSVGFPPWCRSGCSAQRRVCYARR